MSFDFKGIVRYELPRHLIELTAWCFLLYRNVFLWLRRTCFPWRWVASSLPFGCISYFINTFYMWFKNWFIISFLFIVGSMTLQLEDMMYMLWKSVCAGKSEGAFSFQQSYPYRMWSYWALLVLSSSVPQKPNALCQGQQLQGALLIRAYLWITGA